MTVGEKLSQIKCEDQFDIFGKNVAVKLRALPHVHRMYAEKKINDALFDAELAAFQEQSMNNHSAPTNSFTVSGGNSQNVVPNLSGTNTPTGNLTNLNNFYCNYNPTLQ